MRRFLLLCLCLVAATLWADALPEAFLYFNAATDKHPLSYEAGEPIVFTIHFGGKEKEIPAGTLIHWIRKGDDGVSEEGRIPFSGEPVTYTTSLGTQGFVWLLLNLRDAQDNPVTQESGRQIYASCGAAVHPEALQGNPVPEDFDAYWEA